MAEDDSLSKPLYTRVAEAVQKAIQGGEWALGARMPSERSLRERFGVSRVTVQKALDELLRAGWRGGNGAVCWWAGD